MSELPDRTAALQRVGGDPEALRELATVFLRNCPDMLAQIRAAVEDRSATDLAAAAHKLKGAAGFVGAGAVAEQAEQLEIAARRADLEGVAAAAGRLAEAAAVAVPVIEGWTV